MLSSSSTPSPSHGNAERDVVEQESDEFMIEWALREKIIERKSAGGYRLCVDSGGEAAEEEDADADVDD